MKKLKVEDFATVITGGTPSTRVPEYWENGDVPWLTSGDLNQGMIESASKCITQNGLKNSSARLMPPNTVAIALTGATTGVVGYLKTEACGNQSVTGILPSEHHDSKYLYYFLNSIREKVQYDSYGGAQPHISQKYVKEILVPLPPLAEQKRIADLLDKADALRKKNKELLAAYDELLKATFLDMFGDPVSNPKDLKRGVIGDLVSSVNYGTSSKAEEDGQYPYLRMNNITYSGEMDFSDLKYINISSKDIEKYTVKRGDLLFNRTNSKELVGKTAVFRKSEPMVIAGYIIRVRPNEKANSEYLSGFLNSAYGKSILKGLCKSIVGMANINAKELQKIRILVPPINEQKRFAQIVENIEAQKALVKQCLQESEDLFNGLVQKAFKD